MPSVRVLLTLSILLAAAPAGADDPIPPLIIPKDTPPPKKKAAPRESRAAPTAVAAFRGRYCGGLGPKGWAVIAENAQRVAFGADFSSRDGKAGAGYAVFGGGSLTGMAGSETPDRAVAASLSGFGRIPTQFSNWRQLGPSTWLIEYQSQAAHGIAFYEVFPAGAGGFVVVMRTAVTPNGPGLWPSRIQEAAAVARSVRCQVPNVPPAPDPPSLNRRAEHPSGGTKDDDTLYNRWLDKEYYHNAQTGENYWVSPSEDWVQNGPDGPGYYARSGNSYIKLDPGYSQ